jgi:hypothetical protein
MRAAMNPSSKTWRTGVGVLVALSLSTLACDDKQSEAKAGEKKETADTREKGKEKKEAKEATEAKAETKSTPEPAVGDGSLDGAKALLGEFVKPGADHEALTKKLIPQPDDYAAVFEGDFADKAKAHFEALFADPKAKVAPNEGQTEVLVSQATTEDLRTRSGDAGKFPSGYSKIANHLKPGVTWYAFKFVKPGGERGMAFDGLTFVNGHWAFFLKPFRVR